MEVIDWLMPRTLPWMVEGVLRERVARTFVQQRAAKQTAGKKRRRKEVALCVIRVNRRRRASRMELPRRMWPG